MTSDQAVALIDLVARIEAQLNIIYNGLALAGTVAAALLILALIDRILAIALSPLK
jgi:hypothetical protein